MLRFVRRAWSLRGRGGAGDALLWLVAAACLLAAACGNDGAAPAPAPATVAVADTLTPVVTPRPTRTPRPAATPRLFATEPPRVDQDAPAAGAPRAASPTAGGRPAVALTVTAPRAAPPGGFLIVTASLSGPVCNGAVTVYLTVTDSAGKPVRGATVSGHAYLKDTSDDLAFPPTDVVGNSSAAVHLGRPVPGFFVQLSVHVEAGYGDTLATGDRDVLCPSAG